MQVTELRNELVNIFEDLKAGRIDPKHAAELNNTAGKILSSAKAELAYHALRGTECPVIAFLEPPAQQITQEVIEGEFGVTK